MDVEQVLALVLRAERIDPPRRLPDGTLARVHLRDVALAGHRFDALFVFRGDRLERVTLSLVEELAGFAAALLVHDAVGAEIGAGRSGAPERGGVEGAGVRTRRSAWRDAQTEVSVVSWSATTGQRERAGLDVHFQPASTR